MNLLKLKIDIVLMELSPFFIATQYVSLNESDLFHQSDSLRMFMFIYDAKPMAD